MTKKRPSAKITFGLILTLVLAVSAWYLFTRPQPKTGLACSSQMESLDAKAVSLAGQYPKGDFAIYSRQDSTQKFNLTDSQKNQSWVKITGTPAKTNTYQDALENIYIFKDRAAPVSYSLEMSDNISVAEIPGGMIAVKSKVTGEELLVFKYPQGIDAAGQRLDFALSLSGNIINIAPNRDWQLDCITYPVTLYSPIVASSWDEALVNVGDGCDAPSCDRDGDIMEIKPSGWSWGTEEKKRFVIVKIPKLTDIQRKEYTSTTSDLDAIPNLARYGIDYSKLATADQLKQIRDPKTDSPVLNAINLKEVLIKKFNPKLSVVPDSSRLSYQNSLKALNHKTFWEELIPMAEAAGTVVKTIGSANRDYSTLQSWEDAQDGDLVTATEIHQGVAYKDSVFGPVHIDDSTTSSSYYMNLIVAPGDRHRRARNTGAKIDCNHDAITGINIIDDYTRADGFEITQCDGVNGVAGVRFTSSATQTPNNSMVENMYVYDQDLNSLFSTGGIIMFSNGTDITGVTVRNSIIYRGDAYAIRGDDINDSMTVENVTIYGGGTTALGISDNNSTTMTVKNTIIADTTTSDINIDAGSLANIHCEDNAADCNAGTVAVCTSCLYNQTAANQFINTTALTENLHLKAGSTAIDAGAVNASFTADIDAELRPFGPAWDIGADEYSPTEPVSFWRFDEGYGTTANDANSTYSNNLTISGSTWQPEDQCLSGKCLKFDGSNDNAAKTYSSDTDLDPGTRPFTVSAWFKHSSTLTGTDTLIGRFATGGYKIYTSSAGLCFGIDNDGTSFPVDSACSTTTYADSTWHHLVAVKNGTTSISLYIDGQQQATDTSITSSSISGSSANMVIGDESTTATTPWDGFIDEVKFYTFAQTPAQVLSELNSRSAVKGTSAQFADSAQQDFLSQGLIGYWKLDESSGNVTDSSGNGLTLTNNGTTTFVGGKFGNGSEHVPASSQYYNLSSSDTYYFNGNTVSDPNEMWSNDSDAFDGETTFAASTINIGSIAANYILGEDTNAPGSGGSITSVQARIFGDGTDDLELTRDINATVYTNGLAEEIGTAVVTLTNAGWGSYTTLSAPTGGWTWAKIQTLEAKVYMSGSSFQNPVGGAYAVEILVTSGSGSITSGVNTVSFWTNPDSTTNYYLSLASGAYITSTSGVLSATGFTNPIIYVNGVRTSTIAANQWQLVTVTSDTAITADQFYIGRQGANYYDGTLDEVRLYNHVLSPAEIEGLYKWAPGPTAFWNMDENTGQSVNDSSGNGNTAVLGTSTSVEPTLDPKWAIGKFGSGLQIDIAGQYIDAVSATALGFPDATKAFTIGLWVKTTGTGEYYLFDNCNSCGRNVSIRMDGGKIETYINDGTNNNGNPQYGAASAYNNGAWHYVTLTWDGAGKETVYADGILLGSTTSASVTGSLETSLDFEIGTRSGGPHLFNNGFIDNIIVYNYARTQSQVISDMNAGHPAPGSPVGSAIAHWKLDDGFGTTAQDSSINNNDLTLSAASWNIDGKFGRAWNGTGAVRMSRSTDSDLEFSATDNFTISTWFKSDGTGVPAATEYLVADGGPSGSAGYAVYINTSGYVCFGIDDDTSWGPDVSVCNTADVYDSSWHHVVAVRDVSADNIYIYVDGLLKDIEPDSTSATLDANTTFYVGDIDTDDAGSGEEFAGDIDELKVYRLAMNADQVKVEFNQGSAAVWGATGVDTLGNPTWATINKYCPAGYEGTCVAPISDFSFDENTGTTAYSSTDDNTFITLDGNPLWTSGIYGQALLLDGVNDFGDINDPESASLQIIGDLTIDFWINFINPETDDNILSVRCNSSTPECNNLYLLRLVYTGGTVDIQYEHQYDTQLSQTNTFDTNLAKDTWYHITVVRDVTANTVKLYVNSVLNGTYAYPTSDPTEGTGSLGDFRIGNSSSSGSRWLYAAIDQLMIFDYVRSPVLIGFNGNRTPAVVHYKFDECQNNTAYNSAVDGNGDAAGINGTLTPGGAPNSAVGDCSQTSSHMRYSSSNGKRNAALEFDATDDYVSTTNTNVIDQDVGLANSLTISAWIKPNSDGESDNGHIFKKNTNTWCKLAGESAGKANLVCSLDLATDATLTVTGAITINSWNHIVLTWTNDSDDEITLYVNGKAVGTSTDGSGDASADSANLIIGNDSTSHTYTFDGLIDEFKIFDYELNPSQIKVDYNSGAVNFSS